jgi:hypothetical protein
MVLRSMRQEDLKFKVNLSYIARPCIKISKNLKIIKKESGTER